MSVEFSATQQQRITDYWTHAVPAWEVAASPYREDWTGRRGRDVQLCRRLRLCLQFSGIVYYEAICRARPYIIVRVREYYLAVLYCGDIAIWIWDHRTRTSANPHAYCDNPYRLLCAILGAVRAPHTKLVGICGTFRDAAWTALPQLCQYLQQYSVLPDQLDWLQQQRGDFVRNGRHGRSLELRTHTDAWQIYWFHAEDELSVLCASKEPDAWYNQIVQQTRGILHLYYADREWTIPQAFWRLQQGWSTHPLREFLDIVVPPPRILGPSIARRERLIT